MTMKFTRRSFLKSAGTATGVMIATGFSPFTYAQNEKVRLGVIGTGGQGNIHIRGGLAGTPDIEIMAVCDIYPPHLQAGQIYGWFSNAKLVDFEIPARPTDGLRERMRQVRKPNAYADYHEMLEKEPLDAVLIATPLDTHYQLTMDCLDAGKFVFCEKTMCFTIEQGRAIVIKAHEKGKFVQVGHQRRYNPEYNLAIQLAREGLIGRINFIEMHWHRNNNWRRAVDEQYWAGITAAQQALILQYSQSFAHHMNWRIYNDKSLGLCSELLPHQADISNWFLGKLPARIWGRGGNDYWRDDRTTQDNIELVMEYEIKPGADKAFKAISPRSQFQDKTKINKGYTVPVMYSSIMANAKVGVNEIILGDDGAFELTENRGCFLTREAHKIPQPMPKPLAPGQPTPPLAPAATVGGGYLTAGYASALEPERLIAEGMELTPHMYQFRAFTHHIKNGGKPRTNEMCGLSTTIVSALAYQAITERREIEVDPKLMAFDFETPDWTEHGPLTA